MKKNIRKLVTAITITTMVLAMAMPCLAKSQVRVESLPQNEAEAKGEFAPGLDHLPTGVSGWEERELKTQPVKIQPLDEDPTLKREGPNRKIAEKTGGQTPDYTIK